jgi:hypothetical protein
MTRLCLLVLLVGAWPQRAAACSGYTCENDQFLPRYGVVPANSQLIAWQPGARFGDDEYHTHAADLSLECTSPTGEQRRLSLSTAPVSQQPSYLMPSEALVEGEVCRITGGIADCDPDYANAPLDPGGGSYVDGEATFEVSAASPEPETLGELVLDEPKRGSVELSVATGECSTNVPACVVSASVALSDAALPWRDVLLYTAYVDNARWFIGHNIIRPTELGGLSEGRERTMLFALSNEAADGGTPRSDGLAPGPHTIVIEAHLPGSDRVLSTEKQTVDLSCGATVDDLDDADDEADEDGETPAEENTVMPMETAVGGDSCAVSNVGQRAALPRWGFAAFVLLGLVACRRRS